MPQRFGQADDYSSVFASLYYRNREAIEESALRVEREREEREAARDALVFTKWQEGKISGSELMAYIQRRMRETRYDKAQQLQWREAAITYGSQIADEEAEARYAETGNITALITHYAGRLASAKAGTPERRQLAERLSGLREKRDQENLERQARKLARQIQRGDKSTKDLIRFYADQLKTLPKGELRQQVMDQLSQLREQYRQEQFTSAMTRIDSKLASGAISPQQAADQKQALLGQYEVQTRSPEEFWQWQEDIRRLRATPDPVEVEKLEYGVAKGTVTPEQYVAQINIWASRIAPYDQAAAWQMRTEAERYISEYATPLANPGAIGASGGRGYSGNIEIAKNLRGASIKHLTQLDNSTYASTNCAMASGAMLAYAMGARNLSGADLRYISGDTSGGTNVGQVQAALAQLGLKGTQLNYGDTGGASYEQFKRRLANGSPAVLQGFNDMLPPELLPYDYRGAHSVFVAGYDAKKDAFLVLDPAKRRDPGVWWPAQVIRNFGFENGRMDGLALFAPRNTLDPKTLARVGGKVKFINVDATPQLKSTPRNAGGLYDPGPQLKVKLAEANRRAARSENKRINERLRAAGIEPGEFTTEQEVSAELERRSKAYFEVSRVLDEYAELVSENGEFTQDVVVGGVTTPISLEDYIAMSKEQLYLLDGQESYYDALGDYEGMENMRKAKKDIVKQAIGLRAMDLAQAQDRIAGDISKLLKKAGQTQNTGEFMDLVNEANDLVVMLAEAEAEEQSTAPDTEVGRQAEKLESDVDTGIEGPLQNILSVISDPEMDKEDKMEVVKEIAKAAGLNMPVEELVDVNDSLALLTQTDEDGQPLGTAILIGGEMMVIPTKPSTRNLPDGTSYAVRVPALEALGADARGREMLNQLPSRGYDTRNPETLPRVFVPDGMGGIDTILAIPDYVDYDGVNFLQIPDGITEQERANLPESIRNLPEGTILDQDQVNDPALNTPTRVSDLLGRDLLKVVPLKVERLLLVGPNGKVVAWFRDEGTKKWHRGALPFVMRKVESDNVLGNGYVGGGTDEVTGKLWPDVETDPDLIDDTDLGVPIPYAPGISQTQARSAFLELEAQTPVETDLYRDMDGNVVTHDKTSEEYNGLYLPKGDSILGAMAKLKAARDSAIQKVVQVGAARAEELAFFDDMEKREIARLAGIDYDKDKWLPEVVSGMGNAGITLEQLGLNKGEEKKPAEEPSRFDPVGAIVGAALGVAEANKKARAEREAEKEAASKLTLPPVETKPARRTTVADLVSRAIFPEPKAPEYRAPGTQRAPLTRNASTGDMPPELPTAGTAHANRTRPPAPPPTSSYSYTPPKMDEEGRTALGGGR